MHPILPIHILVIEDNPGDFLLLKEALRNSGLAISNVSHAERMEESFNFLKKNTPDLIFLDLSLPDSEGLNSFVSLQEKASHLPIIVLSGLTDINIALDAISMGAQDYLVKGEYTNKLLAKAIQYSIERKRTELKLQESIKRYELISKTTNDAIWEWDLKTNEEVWNDGVKLIFGYTDEQVRNNAQWWRDNIHPEDQERVINKIHDYINRGMIHWQDEYRFRCGDGTYKDVYDRGSVLLNGSNKPYRMIGAMMDITERKKLERALSREKINKQRQLAQATIDGQEKERGEIGKELHDNINQVLATTKLYLEVATGDEKMRIEMMKRSTENIIYCINEIRRISKSLVPPAISDLGIIDSIKELIETIELSTQLKIKFHCSDNIAKKINNQQQLALYRIIQEQFNNIIKHADATTVTLRLEDGNGFINLSIEDNGKGFDPSSKRAGIGLTNIQNRAELLNGFVEIISARGNGCKLKVRMPEQIRQMQ